MILCFLWSLWNRCVFLYVSLRHKISYRKLSHITASVLFEPFLFLLQVAKLYWRPFLRLFFRRWGPEEQRELLNQCPSAVWTFMKELCIFFQPQPLIFWILCKRYKYAQNLLDILFGSSTANHFWIAYISDWHVVFCICMSNVSKHCHQPYVLALHIIFDLTTHTPWSVNVRRSHPTFICCLHDRTRTVARAPSVVW